MKLLFYSSRYVSNTVRLYKHSLKIKQIKSLKEIVVKILQTINWPDTVCDI